MHAAIAGAIAALATYFLTPLAIRVALRAGFVDLPVGYKGHKRATPYLGGAAIVAGLLLGVALSGGFSSHYLPIIACAVGVWVMGTLDDKLNLPIRLRLGVEIAVGVVLSRCGLGWTLFHEGAADTILSVIWVVGVMNAFNLMDNMDGASATTAGISSLGAGVLALMSGRAELAPLCFATTGACLGFLPRNLANPAKIFMGDGGSLPLGLVIGAVAMSAVTRDYLGPNGVVIAALLVGMVILDTTLVTISRSRAGRPVMSGGRDHLTHRLALRLESPRRVALTLAITQFALCGVTIAMARAGAGWVLLAGAACFAFGAVLIWQFETSSWFRADEGSCSPLIEPAAAVDAVASSGHELDAAAAASSLALQ
jgi:UDP-GlcNAc:undecaprenyl-phosphate/decaprenyl-phosphate GlcNAc-1-phosphate transferase